MMIKGTLLVSLPIVKRFSVENFLSPKMHTFCSVNFIIRYLLIVKC